MSDQTWECPNCKAVVTTCVPVQGVWCSCPGRVTKQGTPMQPRGPSKKRPKSRDEGGTEAA